MPVVDDIVRFELRSEQQGVAMSNTLHYQIVSLGDEPTVRDAAIDFATQFRDSIASDLSDKWAITCVLFTNETDPTDAQVPAFTNLAGSEAILPPHPSNQVVNVTRYCNDLSGALKHGSIKLSGLHTGTSQTGRVAVDLELGTLEPFLLNNVILLTTGWEIAPVLKYLVALGPPKVYEYQPVTQVINQGVFRKLRRRSTSLCGSS